MPDYKTTTSNHYCEPHGHEYIVPTRHGLSPRNPVSSVSQSIFGDGYLQFSPRSKVNAGIKLPPLGSINAIGKTAAEPEDPDPPSGKMSTAEQIAYLEVALRHEPHGRCDALAPSNSVAAEPEIRLTMPSGGRLS